MPCWLRGVADFCNEKTSIFIAVTYGKAAKKRNMSKQALAIVSFLMYFLSASGQISSPSATCRQTAQADSVYMFASWSDACVTVQAPEQAAISWYAFDADSRTFATLLRTVTASTDTLRPTEPGGIMATVTAGGQVASYRCWCFVPAIDSVTFSIDSLTCQATYVTAAPYGADMLVYSADKGFTPIKQKYIYTWSIADTVTQITNYAQTELDPIMSDGRLRLSVANQAMVSDTASVAVEPYGVKARFSYKVRERGISHEVEKGDALSAPVEVEFTNNSKGAFTVSEWEMGSGARLYDTHPVYSFKETGQHRITLTVTDEGSGCSSADSTLQITVTDAFIGFPDVFTPNGDNVNDVFRPAYKSIKNYHITIYSRWGRKVYESTDIEGGWDGTIGSAKAADGVYMYVAEADGFDKGVHFTRKGSVTLSR